MEKEIETLLKRILSSEIDDSWNERLHPRGGNPKNRGWFSKSRTNKNWKVIASRFGKTKEDGTFNNEGKKIEYNDGYQVTFVRPEASKLSNKDYNKLVKWFSEKTKSKPHLGVWQHDAEISFHTDDENFAAEMMEKFKQDSVLIWKKKALTSTDNWKEAFLWNSIEDEKERGEVNYGDVLKEIR